jgi:uncharacterized protein
MIFFSEFQNTYYWLPLIGLIIGLLATMLGSGGGLFFPLILMVLYAVPAHIAVATSLAAAIPLTLVGGIGHYFKKHTLIPLALVFGSAGVVGALGGAYLTTFISARQLKVSFGAYSVLLALLIFANLVAGKSKHHNDSTEKSLVLTPARTARGAVHGLAGGMISGVFGSSGAAPVLSGLMSMNLSLRHVAGTSMIIVFINTFSAMTGHFIMGEIDMMLVLLLTTGSVTGAVLGPRLLDRLNPENHNFRIRCVFAMVTLIAGIVLIINH